MKRAYYNIPVSIHAPWEGCDTTRPYSKGKDLKFQFTHPGKGATPLRRRSYHPLRVSIHAPWEGCDLMVGKSITAHLVSIHAPWEGCDWGARSDRMSISRFNSRTLGRVRRGLL